MLYPLPPLNPVTLTFSGHETCILCSHWLKKAYDLLRADPALFAHEDAFVRLGVGKNMAQSIRYWGRVCGIFLADQPGTLRLTWLGDVLFDDATGWAPFLVTATNCNTLKPIIGSHCRLNPVQPGQQIGMIGKIEQCLSQIEALSVIKSLHAYGLLRAKRAKAVVKLAVTRPTSVLAVRPACFCLESWCAMMTHGDGRHREGCRSMDAMRIFTTIETDGELRLANLPFKKGQRIELLILSEPPTPDQPPLTASELCASALIGLWSDRDDLGSSIDVARQLRAQAEQRNRD